MPRTSNKARLVEPAIDDALQPQAREGADAAATDITRLDAKGLQARLRHLDETPADAAPQKAGADPFAVTSYITAATAIAASKGIRLLVGTDFFEFQRYLALQPESPAISAMFSATPGKVAPKDGFWIIGLDDRGDVVHSQAMRLLDLSDKVLAEHLGSHYLSYIPGAETIDPALASYTPSLGPRSISGRVVCHGHLWLKGGADGYRGSGLIAVLPRLAMAVALRRWSPDYLFGFIYPLAACKGLAAREGYMHLEPGNLRWTMPAREDPIDGWLVWMSQADITYLLSLGLSDIFEKLESTKRG